MDRGQIVAEGDPDEIADMHEQDAAKRARQKRKAKQLMMHGVAAQEEIQQARKEGTLDDLIDEKADEVEEAKAEKQRQVEEKRALRRARRQQEVAKGRAGGRKDSRVEKRPRGKVEGSKVAPAGPPAPDENVGSEQPEG